MGVSVWKPKVMGSGECTLLVGSSSVGSEVLHVSGLVFFYCPTCEREYMSDFLSW